MKKLFTLLVLLTFCALGAPASAEIDLTVSDVWVEEGSGGFNDVVAVIDLRTHGPLSANNVDVTLRLDTAFGARIWIDYGLYVAPGCTYTDDYMGTGNPACYDDPGCDLWSINGDMIPGDCVLIIPGGVPLSCWCNHPWLAIFQGVNLSGVDVLEVIADEEETLEEYWEDNNVFTVASPVGSTPEWWGTIKGLYR